MSARKSFDVQRSPRATKAKPQAPQKKRRPVSRDRRPLKVRRSEERQRTGVLWLIGFVIVAGALIYLLWRPEIRIQTVEASGAADPASLERITKEHLAGTYWYIFPRDSFFLYPERTIRAAILDAHPDVSAVSVSRSGFSSVSIEALARSMAFHWCGTPEAPDLTNCYETDAEGLVFARAQIYTASSTPPLQVYASLEMREDGEPLRARVVGAERVPDILRFSRAVKSLGIPVDRIAIRGDEADLFAPHNTRITYVIGHEESAAKGVAAAFPNLNLMDGSLEYVDLRFDGKVYVQRREEQVL